MRVSTADQNAFGKEDRLPDAGTMRIFADVIAGACAKWPALAELIDHAPPCDILCDTRFHRWLGELLEIVEGIKEQGFHLGHVPEY